MKIVTDNATVITFNAIPIPWRITPTKIISTDVILDSWTLPR